jgi:hypothetical protein
MPEALFAEDQPPEKKAWNLPGHVLVVGEYSEHGDHFDVRHPEGCPVETMDILSDESEKPVAHYLLSYECAVGEIVSQVGLETYFVHADEPEDPDPWRTPVKVGVGRHDIVAWEHHYSGVPGYSEPEWESGLALAEETS